MNFTDAMMLLLNPHYSYITHMQVRLESTLESTPTSRTTSGGVLPGECLFGGGFGDVKGTDPRFLMDSSSPIFSPSSDNLRHPRYHIGASINNVITAVHAEIATMPQTCQASRVKSPV